MINNLLDILLIFVLISIIANILKGLKDKGDEAIPSDKGRTLIILPTKDPPHSFGTLINQLINIDSEIHIVIVYQGRKPELIEKPPGIERSRLTILQGVEEEGYKGKVANLVTALKNIDLNEYDYLVIVDDDIHIHGKWLPYLKGLADKYGFSTGYRVYIPIQNRLGSYLASAWNLYTLDTIYGKEERIIWGGSACIKKGETSKEELLKIWRGSVSDDVPLTYLARCRKGIGFNEYTLIPSPSKHSLKDAIEFIVRQQRIVYTYNKRLWRKGVLIHLLLNLIAILIILSTIKVIFGLATALDLLKLILGISVFTVYSFKNSIRIERMKRIFGDEYFNYLNRLHIVNIVFTPLILLLQLPLLIISVGNRIRWRGTTYVLPPTSELNYIICDRTS